MYFTYVSGTNCKDLQKLSDYKPFDNDQSIIYNFLKIT